MKKFATIALGLVATTGFLAACKSEGNQEAQTWKTVSESPLTVEATAEVKVTSTVMGIDYATREVTLADSVGHMMSMIASPRIQRLNEVRVGDTVTAECSVSLTAVLRPPTAEEVANPISRVQLSGRSPKGADPAGVVTRGVRVVTTIEALDPMTMLVVLQGPMGDVTAVRAREPENFKRLHVGDTIVITYVEGTALSLSKPAK